MIDSELCMWLLQEEIERNGQIQLTVHGDSMLPIIKDGEVVAVVKSYQYNIGDVIAYYMIAENRVNIVVHRVIFSREKYVLSKGDNNDFIDPLRVPIKQIIGKII